MSREIWIPNGPCIVMAAGRVWVGEVKVAREAMVVEGAQSVLDCGVPGGLEQLAMDGPSQSTLLGPPAYLWMPLSSVVAVIMCDYDAWLDVVRKNRSE